MRNAGLVPLKRVLDEIGVSRTTLWRALNSGIEGFPAPVIVRRRVYWTGEEMKQLEAALDDYRGRYAFDAKRLLDRQHAESRRQEAVRMVKKPRGMNRRGENQSKADVAQSDMFES